MGYKNHARKQLASLIDRINTARQMPDIVYSFKSIYTRDVRNVTRDYYRNDKSVSPLRDSFHVCRNAAKSKDDRLR